MSGNDTGNRLKRAVMSQPVPPHLEVRVRKSMREAQSPRSPFLRFSLAAAGFALIAVGLFLYRERTQSEEFYIASVSNRVTTLMRVGLGDHIHCAILQKWPRWPASIDEVIHELGTDYAPILPAVTGTVPFGFKVSLAHRCGFEGREFVHLVMKNEERVLSVVVTERKAGETLAGEKLLPALAQSGIDFYRQGAGHFQIAAFESTRHLVYVISDLPAAENMRVMLAVASRVNDALPRI